MTAPVVHFVAGVPRAGSTLLMNLLAQNPALHPTPTNDLIALVSEVAASWDQLPNFKAQGIEKVKPRIAGLIRGMIHEFYSDELSMGQTVFDKSRGWPRQIEVLEAALGRPVRIICPVRRIEDVVASFERRYRNNPLGRPRAPVTVEQRAQLWTRKKLIGRPVAIIRDAVDRGLEDRLIYVPYDQLCAAPQVTLNYIHHHLGLAPFVYDPENVEQVTEEDDAQHGWGPGLHTVRSRVEPPTGIPSWEGVLPPRLARRLAAEFADINQLSGHTIGRRDRAALSG